MMDKSIIAIVIPVFNDWESLQQLIYDLDVALERNNCDVSIFAVNDGSTVPFTHIQAPEHGFKSIKHIEILHLTRNIGHQRAIAVGLAFVEKNCPPDQVVVMDADGEDAPSELPAMILRQQQTASVVFARRGQRQEGLLFKFYYAIFRVLFYALTGKKISFGNFCVIPGNLLRQIVLLPEIWGHFASGVLRSGLPQTSVLVDRKKRYFSKSKMNFVSLVIHGLSAFSVYTDILSVRLMLFTFVLIGFIVLGAFVLVYIRYFTGLAIPGWATTVGFGLVMILFQSILLLLSLTFNMINSRSAQIYIPAKYFEDFLFRREVAYG